MFGALRFMGCFASDKLPQKGSVLQEYCHERTQTKDTF